METFVKYRVPVYDNPDTGGAIVDAAIATADSGIVRSVLRIRNGPAKEQIKNGMALAVKLESFEAESAIASLMTFSKKTPMPRYIGSTSATRQSLNSRILSLIET